ncbi:hypothetical protein P5673_010370 [Acropora cervicornis]|uniref:Uncharacterized protein n=1 Tax=Acropora cervicornis TaxID=6130 RepID=A0AAD9V9C6_ACRCE|nr:hypothetical protein P5673_010370 [Acropora cervicornis]
MLSAPVRYKNTRVNFQETKTPKRLYRLFDRIGTNIANYRPEACWCKKCATIADTVFSQEPDYNPPPKVPYKYKRTAYPMPLLNYQKDKLKPLLQAMVNLLMINRDVLHQLLKNSLTQPYKRRKQHQNKGNAKAIQATINYCIVPHSFGDHKNCDTKWCRFMQDPASYKHHDLPYGKDLFGDKLRSALENIFSDYCTDAVADKLAPMTNSQRNEALNSVVGSKNPKIRFYGGSDSNDFRVACGVAQTNLRYGYVSQTLEALNIEPGKYCTEYNDRMTTKVLQDKIRKSTVDFKRKRSQLNSQKCSQAARKEAQEGKTYETGIGLNLELTSIVSSPVTDWQARVMAMPHNQFKEIEDFVPKITLRPVAKEVKFENNIFYNFLIFDTETNATGKSAEICQLSVTDKSASHKFSVYIMPTQDIDLHASKVNKLKIVKINGERKMYKDDKVAHDALEDVLALRKILFSSKLELSNRTIVENSALTDTNHAFKDLEYLDGRHKILQSFRGKLYNPERNDGAITKSIAEKIAGSGLAYEDLKNLT